MERDLMELPQLNVNCLLFGDQYPSSANSDFTGIIAGPEEDDTAE